MKITNSNRENKTETELWYLCPKCGKKLIRYKTHAVAAAIYLKCRGCRQEIEVKI